MILLKQLNKNQLSFFFLVTIFLINIIYILSDGFISNEEFSDKVFLTFSLIVIEIFYILLSNKFLFFKAKKNIDYFIFYTIILFSYLIWSSNLIYSYNVLILFIFFQIYLLFCFNLFLKNSSFELNIKNNEDLILALSLFLLLSGILYNISYNSYDNYLITLIIAIFSSLFVIIFKKINPFIDLILGCLIFLILFKVFLISSNKDAFHFSWYLGPINSINSDYNLLKDIVSQYGFLNILITNKFSNFLEQSTSSSLIFLIIFFFLIFFNLFYKKINTVVNLPKTVVIIFLCFLVFGNLGYANINTSIFIPSSSVFRFLPSIITTLLLINLIQKNNFLNSIYFYLSFTLALLWSFESLFFIMFTILSFFIFSLLNSFFLKINDSNFFSRINYFNFFCSFLLILTLIFYFYDKNLLFFYEYVINEGSAAPKKIIKNNVSLLILYLIFLSYLIMRDSVRSREYFNHNILLFSLLLSFSSYFLIRSVDNNVFNLLPFFIFIICSMKIFSSDINLLRNLSIYIIIFFSIITSLNSIFLNKEKFFSFLFNKEFIIKPDYLTYNFKPHYEIEQILNKYDKIPITLVTGKTIHEPNINLNNQGYGLPILPLEQFNVLSLERKQSLYEHFFSKSKKHLILCTFNCYFYYDNEASNYFNKIFIGEDINLSKIKEINLDDKKEILYLLSKKNL